MVVEASVAAVEGSEALAAAVRVVVARVEAGSAKPVARKQKRPYGCGKTD
jgi:hypothetical protein